MKPIQSDYRFTFSCAAGDFDVIYFDVTEELSEPFHLRLDLSRMNEDPVSFSDALDNPGTLTFWKGPEPIRYLNGIISFFHQTEAGVRRTRYTAIIEPTYIRAEYYSNLRIFQEKTVPEIIDMVLKRDGVAPIRFELEGEHLAREFCVQYRETDRNFVERLAAEEGMFYYFEHSEGSHTLVFCDHVQMLKSLGRILHNPNISASRTEPSLWYFEYQERVATARHKMRDRFFEMPDYDLEHQKVGQNLDNQQTSYERYDYPGRYKEDAAGKPFNQFRLEHERSDTQVATAVSDDLKLTAGKYITLSKAPTAKEQTVWLAVSVTHSATQPQSQKEDAAGGGGSFYDAKLELIPEGQPWRAQQQPKPRVDGPQIAEIAGPPGEEIYCDEYARVKVKFPWDIEGPSDENASCWIRVSQYWAGTKWGGMAIPRIGQEVIVSFLEGDPDQPIITGRTYNANNMPPYDLPAEKTKMTIKSRTHKGEGFNELRFEDEAGREEIFIHAQKDQNNVVLNDETTEVGHDRTEHVAHDETITIDNDRTETVHHDETITIDNDRTETVHHDETITIDNDRTETVHHDETITIDNDRTELIGNDETITINNDRTETVHHDEQITIDNDRSEHVGNDETISIGNDRIVQVRHDEEIAIENNRTEHVGNDEKLTIGNERHLVVKSDHFVTTEGSEHSRVSRDRLEQVDGDHHRTVQGNRNDSITGSLSRTIGLNLQEKAGMKYAVEAGTEIHLKSGLSTVIECDVSITLKSGSSTININPAGVFLDGPVVLIKTGAAAVPGTGCLPDSALKPNGLDVALPSCMANGAGGAASFLSGALSSNIPFASGFAASNTDAMPDLSPLAETLTAAIPGDLPTSMDGLVDNITNSATDFVADTIGDALPGAVGIVDGIVAGGVPTSVDGLVNTVTNSATDFASDAIGDAIPGASEIVDGIIAGGIPTSVDGLVNNITDGVTDRATAAISNAAPGAAVVFDGLSQPIVAGASASLPASVVDGVFSTIQQGRPTDSIIKNIHSADTTVRRAVFTPPFVPKQ